MKRDKKKLTLKKETIRNLNEKELAQVAGGAVITLGMWGTFMTRGCPAPDITINGSTISNYDSGSIGTRWMQFSA